MTVHAWLGLPVNEFAAQFLAQLEECHSLGGHVNALSAARVAALTGATVTKPEAAETA
jgi:hypothetical protein